MKIAVIFSILVSAAVTQGADFHVASSGVDTNPGTKKLPLRTIQRAADLAQPGDVITVHKGVYRERVSPPRGGTSDKKRIVFQAARGERVTITGSEIVKGWERVTNDTWKVSLPNSFFGAFNPYSDLIHGDWFNAKGRQHHTGCVYLNGDWLMEAAHLDKVLTPAGATPQWFATVEDVNTTIWAQFKDANPNEQTVEINVRQTVFTPSRTGINYLTVRGLDLRNAATPWAPPSAGQFGVLSAYWCKGWIIEDNEISYSKCCGVALGKYSDEFDNTNGKGAADPYTDCVRRALANGWNKETIGGHVVRNNHVHHCEQTGIVGSLGCSFSTVTGNEIHDIHIQELFGGAEMAGIKFHGAIDVLISGNHIYRCGSTAGIWLDWMAQGAQVTENLLHDNRLDDIFLEMQHGPLLVANNLFLSKSRSLHLNSQGIAFAHNLMVGDIKSHSDDKRATPFQKPHTTIFAGMHTNCPSSDSGDHRFYNNLFVAPCNLHRLDNAALPCFYGGNVYTRSAQAGKSDTSALLLPDFDAEVKLAQKADGWYLQFTADKSWRNAAKGKWVTTELLGQAKVSGCDYEHRDGSSLRVNNDYFGRKRNRTRPFPGPFASPADGKQEIRVWPR